MNLISDKLCTCPLPFPLWSSLSGCSSTAMVQPLLRFLSRAAAIAAKRHHHHHSSASHAVTPLQRLAAAARLHARRPGQALSAGRSVHHSPPGPTSSPLASARCSTSCPGPPVVMANMTSGTPRCRRGPRPSLAFLPLVPGAATSTMSSQGRRPSLHGRDDGLRRRARLRTTRFRVSF